MGNVTSDAARDLAQKNKFMIEYIAISSPSISIDNALQELRRPEAQHIKIFINTNSVRGADRAGPDPSVLSNRYSFHSLGGETKVRGRTEVITTNGSGDQLKKLNDEVYFLENQRTKLVGELSTPGNGGRGGFLKPLIVFILGAVVGNIGNKKLGVTDSIK